MAKDVEDENWTGSPMEVRLCNFSTGHSDVRADHSKTIRQTIAPILKASPNAWIDVIGYASRLGFASGDSHKRNRDLSQARCASVQREIRRYVPSARFNVVDPEGDADSAAGSVDDGYWRAVKVRIFGAQPQPSPGPNPQPSPRPDNFVCGPDVSDQVATVWTRIQTDFAGLGFMAKINACNAILLPFKKPDEPLDVPDNPLDLEKWKQLAQQFAEINSWDTLPLFQGFSGWLRKPPIYDPKTKGPCATPSSDIFPDANQQNNFDPKHENPNCCANTVQVGGKCWLNGAVNYGSFGIMVRLCSDFANTDIRLRFTPIREVYSLEWAKMLIRAYKRFGANPEGAVLPIAWTEATFNGGPRAVPGVPGNRPKCACTGGCKGDVVPWDYVWNPHRLRPPGVPGWAEGPP